MIPRDALDLLQKTAQSAVAPLRIEKACDATQEVYLVDGEEVSIGRNAPPVGHVALTLDDFAHLTNYIDGKINPESIPYDCKGYTSVFYNEAGLVAVFDMQDHRIHDAAMNLSKSATYASLFANSREAFTVPKFVKFLRVSLAGVAAAEKLIEKVSKVKFTGSKTSETDVGRGRESISKSLKTDVEKQMLDGIPETVTFEVPIWNNPGLRKPYPIRFLLEIDSENETFELVPFPDEFSRVLEKAVDEMGVKLMELLTPSIESFQGTP